MIMPEDITHFTELDTEFAKALKKVKTNCDFADFVLKYWYWLDQETKELEKTDWQWIKPLLHDIRPKSKVIPNDKHDPAIQLAMPEKIFRVSLVSTRFKVPWGCAYLALKARNEIDY